jgi:hypothetical protein
MTLLAIRWTACEARRVEGRRQKNYQRKERKRRKQRDTHLGLKASHVWNLLGFQKLILLHNAIQVIAWAREKKEAKHVVSDFHFFSIFSSPRP